MTGIATDIRFAVRSLRRRPGFTAVAVVTLALGIGATTAVFTLVDSVLLSPLPFDHPDRLIAIRHLGRDGADKLPMSQGLYELYREQASSLEEIALESPTAVNLVASGEAERVRAEEVTPSFFHVLRTEAQLGRTFAEEEGAPDGAPVIILSDGLWRDRFGGDPDVIGRTLDVNGTLRQIIGVMPPDFGHPTPEARLWVPLVVDPARAPLANFSAGSLARFAPGATLQSVRTELGGLIARLGDIYPESDSPAFLEQVHLQAVVLPLKDELVGDASTTLWILLGTVGFVLLIACANVANLLLVRAEGRQRELALRTAIGASRMQVLRTALSESLILSLFGAALGVGVAALAVSTSLGLIPATLPRADEIAVDARVLAFTASVAAACALLFGFVPLLRARGATLADQLRDGSGHGGTGGRRRHAARNVLVVAQMALALVLLVGSGLMFRSFQALRAVDPGFDARGVLTARFFIPRDESPGWEETAGYYRQLADAMEAHPGVEAAGFGLFLPLGGQMNFYSIDVEDQPRGPGELPVFASGEQAGPGFLEAMGIPILEGRSLEEGDGAEGARSVVVSESFAKHWWPGASPLGRRIRQGFPGEEWYQIVGVAGDAHYGSLTEPAEEVVYWPSTVGLASNPQPTRAMAIAVKTEMDPLALVPVLRREAEALNARIPVSDPRTMESMVTDAMSRTSFTMALLGAASGIALLLGLVGIYGVVSYVVSQRTREIGVRIALGATAPNVRGMVVRHGLLLSGVGVAVGLLAAGALSSIMASILYGVRPIDPLTYGTVSGILVLVSLAASWLPARRAAAVDPARALRVE